MLRGKMSSTSGSNQPYTTLVRSITGPFYVFPIWEGKVEPIAGLPDLTNMSKDPRPRRARPTLSSYRSKAWQTPKAPPALTWQVVLGGSEQQHSTVFVRTPRQFSGSKCAKDHRNPQEPFKIFAENCHFAICYGSSSLPKSGMHSKAHGGWGGRGGGGSPFLRPYSGLTKALFRAPPPSPPSPLLNETKTQLLLTEKAILALIHSIENASAL